MTFEPSPEARKVAGIFANLTLNDMRWLHQKMFEILQGGGGEEEEEEGEEGGAGVREPRIPPIRPRPDAAAVVEIPLELEFEEL